MSNMQVDNSGLENSTKVTWVVILRFTFSALLLMAILFLAAGTLDWWEGWAYVVQALVILITSRGILIRKNPDLAKERAEAGKQEDVKPWDRVLMPLMALVFPFLSWIIVGLDERFSWTPDLPNWIQWTALAFLFTGSMIGTWAMISNRFFSSHVRIQHDRGHRVVDSGPYRFIRHPGYAGGLLSWIASPLFFSSYWAVIPTILACVVIFIRTTLEDRTLQEELPGYKEYTERVPFRLIPGIW